jgi:hypothetical protein
MITSKWRPNYFFFGGGRGFLDQIKYFRLLFVKLYFLTEPSADVAGNLFWTEKTVLDRWTGRYNRPRLCILGLDFISGHFLFEFSNVNIIKINLTKVYLMYASVNHKRTLQRQSDDESGFNSAQN